MNSFINLSSENAVPNIPFCFEDSEGSSEEEFLDTLSDVGSALP